MGDAFSTRRRNDRRKFTRWRLIFERQSGSSIQAERDGIQLGLAVAGEISRVRQVLTQQAVGVFVRATLPWALRVTEVHLDIRRNRERTMRREFAASIPRQRLHQSVR